MSFQEVQDVVGFAVNITFLLGGLITIYQFYLSERAAELQKKAKKVVAWLKAPEA